MTTPSGGTDIQPDTEPEAAAETTAVAQAAADADTEMISLLASVPMDHTFTANTEETFTDAVAAVNADDSGTGVYNIVITKDFDLTAPVTLERNSVTLLGVQTTITLTDADTVRLNVSAAASLTLAGNVTLKSGTTITSVGTLHSMIQVDGGTLQLSGNACIDGSDTMSGVGLQSNSIFNMTGGSIVHGGFISGGGIWGTNCTITISGGSIENCTVTSTGGGISLSGGKLELSGGRIANCKTQSSTGFGAGISLYGDEDNPCSLVMTGGNIEDCEAAMYGGGISLRRATADISGGSIVNCKALSGGGIYVADNSSLTLHGSSQIERCEATNSSGGGVHVIDNSQLTMSDSSMIEGCKAAKGGGGIYTYNGTVTLNGGTIQGCSATSGGGISVGSRPVSTTDRLILNGGAITDCTAEKGGGVSCKQSPMTLSSASIEKCSAKFGGGVYLEKTSTLNMTDTGSINDCFVSSGDDNASLGGGVYAEDSTVSMADNSSIADCNVINDYLLSDMVAPESGGGGGVYLTNSSMTMTGGSNISRCTATSELWTNYGGGAYLNDNSSLAIEGGSIQDCTVINGGVGCYGGGVRLTNSSMTMNGSSITDCSALKSDGSSYTMGGGVSLDGSILNMANSRIENCNITDNNGAGGVSLDNSSSLIMTGSIITDCNGLSINISNNCSADISSSQIENGYGGISHQSSLPLTLEDVTIKNCNGRWRGAALYSSTSSDVTLKNVHISDCHALHEGGAIFADTSGKTLTLENCSITNCTARESGGGLWLSRCNLVMTGSSITECHTSESPAGDSWGFAGGIYVDDSSIDITDSVICNNTAVNYAADLWIHSTCTSVKLPDAASMNQPYRGSGYMIDGWYNDPSDSRYEPNADGVSVDITSLPTGENIYLVASYRADDNATPDTTAHTITVALPEDIDFVEGQTVVTAPTTAVLGDEVALTFNPASLPADCGKAFSEWRVTDAKGTPIPVTDGKFTMPASNVTVTFTLVDADAPAPASGGDGGGGAGAGILIGGVAVGAVGYAVGTRLWLEHNIGFVPTDRQQLAGALWNKAGCPAPESTALYPDIAEDDANAQAAARWCVEQGLLEDYGDTFHPGDHVYRFQAIKAWNTLQGRLNAQAQTETGT